MLSVRRLCACVPVVLACTLSGNVQARPHHEIPHAFERSIASLPGKSRLSLLRTLDRIDFSVDPLVNQNPRATEAVVGHETYLPNTAVQQTTRFERALLEAYLNSPRDAALAKLLAAYEWFRFNHAEEDKPEGACRGHDPLRAEVAAAARRFRYGVYAEYFLNRARELGAQERWIEGARSFVEQELNFVSRPESPPVVEENLESHLFFTEAFNYEEQNRYEAVDKLLMDFVEQPNNVVTNAYLASSNIWLGGEAPYNDPTILYDFLLSSYFAVRSVHMAEAVELAWLQDPQHNPPFRLSSILGGWVVPARRWLALVQGDNAAVEALDAEHRQWLGTHRAFHSASVGLMLFDEPAHVLEGFNAWMAGYEHCAEFPELRACSDRPKISFNRLSFVLGGVDYLLKLGQVDAARGTLSVRFDPSYDFRYDQWELGRKEWEHRENNLEAIAALYANADPSDDPTNFLLKSHAWGPNTIVCQTCHQTQRREWSGAEVEQYRLEPAHPDVAVVGDWPEITTTWYGTTIAR
ncbi:MAG TPA: hypothetical protein VFQ61_28530 [Polyangiaceae bacterium]|nr:hypothetical protein [Polyangiaceae bacterium]